MNRIGVNRTAPTTAETGGRDGNRRAAAMKVEPTGNPWLRRYAGHRGCRVRLACLPHAGGTANFFRPWVHDLPADVDLVAVQYPGRQDRFGEEPAEDLAGMATEVARALCGLDPLPLVLFGHSMGALVAYETALRLESSYGVRPRLLVVSAIPPPHVDRARIVDYESDQALREEILRSDPHGPEICADPQLSALVLPALRADFRMADRYRSRNFRGCTGSPLLAYLGKEDPDVDGAGMEDWRAVTRAEFRLRTFAGGHFYLTGEHQQEVVSDLLGRMDSVAAG